MNTVSKNARRIRDVDDFNTYCPVGTDALVIDANNIVTSCKVLSEAWEIDGEGVALFDTIPAPYPIKKVLIYYVEQ